MFNPVARSRHHKALNESYLRDVNDLGSSLKESPATIIQLFDPEYRTQTQEKDPESGFLIALVRTRTGEVFRLPLDHTPEELYSIYGNCNNVRGMTCMIRFRNQDLGGGVVRLGKRPKDLLGNPEDKSFVADIGALWGAGDSE